MYSVEEDEMVFCPYNRYHIVSKLRLQKHIIKCKKNHSDVKLATCFYNYSHRLRPEDMLEHYEVCSHKTRIDSTRYYCEPYQKPSSSPSGKTDPFKNKFPDINVKPNFFTDSDTIPAPSKAMVGAKKKFLADSETEVDDQLEVTEKNFRRLFRNNDINDHESNDGISDDDSYGYQPLPLPKTVSKALKLLKSNEVSKPTELKGFGRGRSLTSFSPPKHSRLTDHLLPDLDSMENDVSSTAKIPRQHSPAGISCSASSMVDDVSTLKAEVINEDTTEKRNFDLDYTVGFRFIDLNKYKKV